MEPIKIGVSKNQGAGFWGTLGKAIGAAAHGVGNTIEDVASFVKDVAINTDWSDVENDLRNYQEQFRSPEINDYAAWKTGRTYRDSVPDVLDGWEYEDKYTGKRPDARLLYVDASGSLSGIQNNQRKRAFGHVALEIDGDVYNYTPEGLRVKKAINYIHNVTHRQKEAAPQTIYAFPLGLTSSEKKQAIQELETYYGKPYDQLHRNCATCVSNSLIKAAMPPNKSYQENTHILRPLSFGGLSPSDVVDSAKQSKRIYGPQFMYQPPKELRSIDSGFWGLQ